MTTVSSDTPTNSQNRAHGIVMMLIANGMFGTMGLAHHFITLGPATLASTRGIFGSLFVLLLMLAIRKKPDLAAIRKNFFPLLLSGAMIGINWILLYEAYDRTGVTLATLFYYTAPVFMILSSPLLGEKLTARKLACAFVALGGMACISGIFGGDVSGSWDGILCGLGAGLFYAAAVLVNKKLDGVGSYDRTLVQMFVAGAAVVPYALITEAEGIAQLSDPVVLLTAVAFGIVYSGIAYTAYFQGLGHLPVVIASLFGYIDPSLTIILAATVLHEAFGWTELIGVVCIIGAMIVVELPGKKETI